MNINKKLPNTASWVLLLLLLIMIPQFHTTKAKSKFRKDTGKGRKHSFKASQYDHFLSHACQMFFRVCTLKPCLTIKFFFYRNLLGWLISVLGYLSDFPLSAYGSHSECLKFWGFRTNEQRTYVSYHLRCLWDRILFFLKWLFRCSQKYVNCHYKMKQVASNKPNMEFTAHYVVLILFCQWNLAWETSI